MKETIARVEPLMMNVSDKTNWFFLRITAEDGVAGIGEASLNGWERAQIAFAESLQGDLEGKRPDEVASLLQVFPHSPGGLIASSVLSAAEQALTDLRARRLGVPVHALLGGKARDAVRVYANINRGARDRSVDGIALAARNAVASGFYAVKIAPFDGVFSSGTDNRELDGLIQAGIDRIYGIREAVGQDIDILVDCHWRFDESRALELIRKLERARLYWLECPVSENPDGFAALHRVHAHASKAGMKLAGAERQIGIGGFVPFLETALLDVVMPDVKYAGGYAEMLSIAEMCRHRGVGFAPHNPTGPICNLASMHICAAARSFLILEHQLAESPLFYDLVHGYRPQLVDGCFVVPDTPGLGVELDDAVLRAHPYRKLAPKANLDACLG